MGANAGQVRIEGSLLEELYVRHASDAGRLAFLLTGDRQLAEDLVQDAFVRLTGRLMHLRNPDGFHHYLRMAVVNMARSHHRRRQIEKRFLERQGVGSQTVSAPDLSDREQLRVALLSLPLRQRTAVVLRFYEDLSERQTAEAMRCSTGTVKSLVSRGMDRLRPLMSEGRVDG